MRTLTLKTMRRGNAATTGMPRLTLRKQPASAPVFEPAPVAVPDNRLHLRVAQLEEELVRARGKVSAANQRLHELASLAWLEAEEKLKAERERVAEMKGKQMRLHFLDSKSSVRDHTIPEEGPRVVVTPSAVSLKLALDPRMAVPLKLPLLQRIMNWLRTQD